MGVKHMEVGKRCFPAILLGLILIFPLSVFAVEQETEEEREREQEEAQEEGVDFPDFSQYAAEGPDYSEIEEVLDEILPEEKITFQELITTIQETGSPWKAEEVTDKLFTLLFQEFRQHRSNLVVIIVLMILSAVFSNFTSVFQNSQVAELGFYSVYLLLVIVLMNDFAEISASIHDTIEHLLEFSKALLPAYCIAVAGMGMVRTATVFYQFILVLIWAIQYVIIYGLLPLANGYVFLILINYIAKEDILTKMAGLMRRLIGWTLKAMIGLVVGFNVIQGMVAPAMDSFKTAVLNRTMSAVPGVGNAAGAVTELVVGSGALIKNGIGAAGLALILYICMSPMIKVMVFTGAYHLVGACMQPVADKRLLGGINGIAEGGTLLFRMMFTAALLLLLTVAILAAATGRVR